MIAPLAAMRVTDAFNAAPVAGADDVVERAIGELARRLAARGERVLLAVSGGRDSMTLLHAVARVAPGIVAGVASFDHGTGAAAAAAVAQVADECARLGVAFVGGRAASAGTSEAAWRAARWTFLRDAARRAGARVATAHTRDDAIETVLMRIMRGAGARGLAALHADGNVERPFLELSRDDIARWAERQRVRWVEDPSNASRAFFRNRVRHELLPALLAVRPALGDELLAIARRAAALRREVTAVVDALAPRREGERLVVAAAGLADYDAEALRTLWGELAARGGFVLDARGTRGLASFTLTAKPGDRMQLSGAVEVTRRRDAIVLAPPTAREPTPGACALPDAGDVEWGEWRFRVDRFGAGEGEGRDRWRATLPADRPLEVRAWRAGDRMHGAGDRAPRRVKRFLRDAGLVGPERSGWPVVVDGAEIVWIPGVRRSDAATVRSGRPEAVYACERIERREG